MVSMGFLGVRLICVARTSMRWCRFSFSFSRCCTLTLSVLICSSLCLRSFSRMSFSRFRTLFSDPDMGDKRPLLPLRPIRGDLSTSDALDKASASFFSRDLTLSSSSSFSMCNLSASLGGPFRVRRSAMRRLSDVTFSFSASRS